MLEGNAHRHHRHPARGDVDLLGEIGQCIRERVVDRPPDGLADVQAGQVAIACVRCDEQQRAIEHRNGQRHRFEQRVEPGSLYAIGIGDDVERRGQHTYVTSREGTQGSNGRGA